MPALRRVSRQEIVNAYARGERNFSGISCTESDFHGTNLSGADFSGSDFQFCDFSHCDLSDCDFSSANLDWCSFFRATMKRTNLSNATIRYSVLNSAIFENTVMHKTDLSWSIMFGVNWGAVDSKGALFTTVAFSPAEITEEGLAHVRSHLAALGGNVDALTQILVESSVHKTSEASKKRAINAEIKRYESAPHAPPEAAAGAYGGGTVGNAYMGTKVIERKKTAYGR